MLTAHLNMLRAQSNNFSTKTLGNAMYLNIGMKGSFFGKIIFWKNKLQNRNTHFWPTSIITFSPVWDIIFTKLGTQEGIFTL